MRINLVQLIKACATRTVPAAETKSIGLPADAHAVMVFAPDSYREPSGQFYHDVTTSYHLPGLSHLDNFIVTRKSCPLTGPDSYRDVQKRMPTLTRSATQLYHRAVRLSNN